MNAKKIALNVEPIVFFAFLCLIYFCRVDMVIFGIELPYRRLPIPVFFWAVIFLHIRVSLKIFGCNRKKSMAFGILIGAVIHLIFSFAELVISIQKASPLNVIYCVYIYTIFISALAASFFCGVKLLCGEEKINKLFGVPAVLASASISYLLIKNGLFNFFITALLLTAVIAVAIAKKGVFLKNFAAKIKRYISDEKRFLVFIFVLAFLLRVLFTLIIVFQTGEDFPSGSDDGPSYDAFALNAAENIKNIFNGSIDPTLWFGSGYWIFLSFIYRLFGRNFFLVGIIQSLFGAIVPAAGYYIGRELFNKETGRLGAFLILLNMPLIHLSVVLGTESMWIPFAMLFIVFLVLYARAPARKERRLLLLSGIAFGIANSIRQVFAYFPPIFFIWLFIFAKKEYNFRKKMRQFLIWLIAAIIISIPVGVRNHLNNKNAEKKPVSAEATTDIKCSLGMTQAAATWLCDNGGPSDPGNKRLMELGINPFEDLNGSVLVVLKRPLAVTKTYAEILSVRLKRFFFLRYHGYFDPISMVNPARYKNTFALNIEFYTCIFIAIGLTAIFKKLAKKEAISWLISLILGYYILLHPFLFRMRNARYRAPIHPFLILMTSYGIYVCYNWIKRGICEANDSN